MTVGEVLLEPSVHAAIDEIVAENPMVHDGGYLVFVGASRDFALLSDAPVTAQLLFPPSDEHDALVNVSIDRDQRGLEVLVRFEDEAEKEFVKQTALRTPLLGDHDGYDSLCRYGVSPVDAWRAVYAG